MNYILLESAIDSLVLKPQNKINSGMVRPPPPMPPIFANPTSIGSTIKPINSIKCIGNIFLWTQMYSSLQI
jgi:hypothetical protein